MQKIFYTDVNAYPNSETAVKYIFKRFFQLKNVSIERNENGKPFLCACKSRLFFSVSHTNGKLFIAISDDNVGIDAESEERQTQYASIVKKFPAEEQLEIRSSLDFLKHWTAKEAAIKWLGGTLSHNLANLLYVNGNMIYKNAPLPVCVCFPPFENYIVAICSERDFSETEYISF